MKNLISDFLQHLREYHKKLEKAFIMWYIETQFGRGVEHIITDGPNDGGIDVVVKFSDVWYILQSKFNNAIFKNRKPAALSTADYDKFDKLPEYFED